MDTGLRPMSVILRLQVVGESLDSFAEKSGFARILQRGRWDSLVEARGGGAFYSFLTRSNSFDDKPELTLGYDRYTPGPGSGDGFLLDLGEIPFDQLGAVMSGNAPSGLGERERETWDFLWSVRATVQDSGRRALSQADAERAEDYEVELMNGRRILSVNVTSRDRRFARGAILESGAVEVRDVVGTFEVKA